MSTTEINQHPSSGAKGTPRIAILNTGKMGSAIAGRLAESAGVVVLNRVWRRCPSNRSHDWPYGWWHLGRTMAS